MPSDENIPAAEFTPHRIPSDEQTPEMVRFLRTVEDGKITLSIVAGGGQLFYRLTPAQVLTVVESGAEAIRKFLAD